MRRLVLLMLLVGSVAAFGQNEAARWGQKIRFGSEFDNTDSLRLKESSVTNTVAAATLYSDVLSVDSYVRGVWTVKAWVDNVGGDSDSLMLEARTVDIITDLKATPPTRTIKRGTWQPIFSFLSATAVNDTLIDDDTSAWWQQVTSLQYRLRDTSVSTDTSTVLVTDYLQ